MTAESPLTPQERETMIEYLIGTQALAGLTVPRADAEAAVDEAYALPLLDLAPPIIRDWQDLDALPYDEATKAAIWNAYCEYDPTDEEE